MGKMKDFIIDQMNNPDDTDWNYKNNQLEPPPAQVEIGRAHV